MHREGALAWNIAVPQDLAFRLLYEVNGLVCRMLYHVGQAAPSPIPKKGAALLVCDHTSYSDALALLATTGRPVVFVVTREVYELCSVRWVLRAVQCIPVRRGTIDVVAGRRMLRTLHSGEVLGIFPEGGIDERRMQTGYPGVGYLALKTGVPVIPASVTWQKPRPSTLWRSLLMPGHATVRYGAPIRFGINPHPDHEAIRVATDAIMAAIQQAHGAMGSGGCKQY
jgi:1-acyl-sn-glycerol-3-phosphate acyltransferase